MENWVLPALAACTVSLVLSVGSFVWCVAFSPAASLRKYVDHALSVARTTERRAEEIESRFVSHKAETAALHESIEGVLDSVEKKRRQISASASRLNLAQEPEPQTREEIVQAGRRKVYGV